VAFVLFARRALASRPPTSLLAAVAGVDGCCCRLLWLMVLAAVIVVETLFAELSMWQRRPQHLPKSRTEIGREKKKKFAFS
jgi:hypothetical protein